MTIFVENFVVRSMFRIEPTASTANVAISRVSTQKFFGVSLAEGSSIHSHKADLVILIMY